MLQHNFTIFLRHIRKRKFFAGINLLGMTAGNTACLLIALYILDEFSYDRFHVNADRLYQVGLHQSLGDNDMRSTSTCPPLADAMMAEIPEVESTLRLNRWLRLVLRNGEKTTTEDNVFFTESNFFEFFSFPLVSGNPKTALKEPNTLVLSETTARKLFGNGNPLEKLVVIGEGEDKQSYKVTGVAADCPGNSHFHFNVLLSEGPDSYFNLNAWLNSGVLTYFLLRENASLAGVENKLENIIANHVAPEVKTLLGTSLEQFRAAGGTYRFYTTPITDIHLRSTSMEDVEPGGSLMYLYVLGGIGLFILAIACINFMNLSTAQSAGRAREVGLRKTLGSRRRHLVAQFLAESLVYSLTAVVMAFVLCYFLLPVFHRLSGKELHLAHLLDVRFLLGVGSMAVIVALLAGSYPSLYLTSFQPADVLRGKVSSGLKSKGIRSTLVVFQFGVSIFLIIFTSVVYNQIKFMQQQQMGMDKKNVMIIEIGQRLGSHGQAFRNALGQQPGVVKASFIGSKFPGTNTTTLMRTAHADGEHRVSSFHADFDSKEVLKFEMKDGRYFSPHFPSDSNAAIINEAAAREFGFDKAEGQEILNNQNAYDFFRFHVIGIMKDFNFESYRDNVRPLAVFLDPSAWGFLMVRYEGNAKVMVDNASKLWKQYAPAEPFEYSFMDENFDKLFRSEERIGQVMSVFSGLAIFIACLGLFALAAFTTEQRTKEIGIRKVMGASVRSLSVTLTKDFIVLVFIAFVPAAVAGWWASSRWLNGFAYRVEINLLIFLAAGLSAMVLAWLTVGYQSVKAARANPADSLRHE